MTLQIEFELRTEGVEAPDAFLDAQEIQLMFDGARRSIGEGLGRKFAAVVCSEHGAAPRFKISGLYDHRTEQMDIQYHVDTCCQRFLLRVMRILNQRN